MKIVDRSGERIGGLLLLRKDVEATAKNRRGTYWCLCDWCGKEKLINSNIFSAGKTVSCGCRKAAGFTNPKSAAWEGKTTGKTPERTLLNYARRNSRRRGEECTLTIDDIKIPEVCPVLGVTLVHGGRKGKGVQDNSPSIDRIDAAKGYTPDNIWIISQRANRIKNNATLEELQLLVEALSLLEN